MTAPPRADVHTLVAAHYPNVVIEGAGRMWQTRIRCGDGRSCDFYAQRRGDNVMTTYANALRDHHEHMTDLIVGLLTEAWADASERTADWMANNPSPAGIPSDPPRNPYEE